MQAAYVPPEQFCVKRWFRPARGGYAWFYHTPAPLRGSSFLRDYSTVDEDLRPIVRMLHAMGIPTMPSCQGHWPDRGWAKRCFEDIQRDAEQIRYAGMNMVDVETGVSLKFSDPFYSLPWFAWQDFHEELVFNQGRGYLAFLLAPGSRIEHLGNELVYCGENVHVHSEPINRRRHLVIQMRERDPMAQRACWSNVREVLSRAR
jgi:hypothetical protein